MASTRSMLKEIEAKIEQLREQILAGVPPDYPAYRAALGSYKALVELRDFAKEQREGDVIDDD